MYYRETDEGFELEYVMASDATVVETNEVPPHLEWTCSVIDVHWFWNFPFHKIAARPDCNNATYTFYVPENSVKSDFVLDAQ